MAGPTVSWNTVPVYGHYLDYLGHPMSPSVTFTPSGIVKDYANRVILYPVEMTFNLSAGSFMVDLPASDDPDITGTFTYHYRENWIGGRAFDIVVPKDTPSPGLDMTTVGPAVATGTFSEYVTSAQLVAALAGVSSGGSGSPSVVDGGAP